MAKKNEDTVAKTTAKKTTKDVAKTTKAAAKTTKDTAKAAKTAKITKIPKEKVEENKPNDANINFENQAGPVCQQMLTSIIDWSLDALMYQNILNVSRKLNISIPEAANILDVNPEELVVLEKIHMVLSTSPDKETVLGRYSKRINLPEPAKKTGRTKKTPEKK